MAVDEMPPCSLTLLYNQSPVISLLGSPSIITEGPHIAGVGVWCPSSPALSSLEVLEGKWGGEGGWTAGN